MCISSSHIPRAPIGCWGPWGWVWEVAGQGSPSLQTGGGGWSHNEASREAALGTNGTAAHELPDRS